MRNEPMKDYGNGILASNDTLAAIGQSYLAELRREEKRRQRLRDEAKYGKTAVEIADLVFDEGQYGNWNISDRD